ncbi:MAG: fibronectin type III domain-containing protein [Ignavibacteriaceae bacterium]|nr:fibronectin type III domain-containing protein [Ignavibacteriaceae bacterium]
MKKFIYILLVSLFLVNIVSAEVFTRFVTSGTFGSQTNENSLFMCDNSAITSYNNAYYDYFTVDNTDLPYFNNITSIDYCIRGLGSINVGMNTERFTSFVGDGSEQCFHANTEDYLNLGENIYLHNGYGLFGGALNIDSSTDCLYVKINTYTPTSTPTPTNTPTPIPTNTPIVTPIYTPTPIITIAPTETSTPTPTPDNSTAVSSSLNSEESGSVSAPTCTDQKPGSAPVLLLATSSGSNSITLNWIKAEEPVSYYLITFGTKSGEQLYGNPNVGDSNTTAYTIYNLSGGQNYYFKVRAGNGCMPGDYSNEVIGRLTGSIITGIPKAFNPDVLGVTIDPSTQSLPTKSVVNKGQIKTSMTNNFSKNIIPILIVIILCGVGWVFKKNI